MTENVEPENAAIPSPQATGQGGGFFEQHVNAAWLSILLVRGIPPLFPDGQVTKVSFQNRRLGWETDDLLVQAETGSGQTKRLLTQVKRSFVVSSSNEESKKTFLAFWADFKNAKFVLASDRLALITLRGSNTLLDHFCGLLDCARSSSSAEDFEQRLATEGLVHAKVREYSETIRKILQDAKIQFTSEEFWNFLRCLSLLSFDLNTKTSQTEAWIRTMLAQTASGADKIGAAAATWNALVTQVSEAMPDAKEYTRDSLPTEILARHEPIPNSDHSSIQSLRDHSKTILRGIRGEIAGGITVPREQISMTALESASAGKLVVISGPSGAGKSALAKQLVEQLGKDHFVFSFRAEEFAKPHLDETLQAVGLGISAERLSGILSAQSRKVIHIESAERLLEHSTRDAFMDLLRQVEEDKSWKVVLTCRSYSVDLVRASFLNQLTIAHAVIDVPELSDAELQAVEKANPALSIPLSNKRLRKLLRNPYILDKAVRMKWTAGDGLPETEREFRKRFWKEIVREESANTQNFPARREATLQDVSLRRAKALSLYAKVDDLDQEALQKLRQQDLVALSEVTDTLASPAHDVLEDWALIRWIETRFAQVEGDVRKLSEEIGAFPALRRCYRMWLSENAELEPAIADKLINEVIRDSTLPAHFRDDTLVSALQSAAAPEFLERNKTILFADNCALLRRVIHLLRVACKAMPEWLARMGFFQSSAMQPTGHAWPKVLQLVQEKVEILIKADFHLVLGLLEDWKNLISVDNMHPEGISEAAKISFRLLEGCDGYRRREERSRLYDVIAKIPRGDAAAFVDLLHSAGRDDREADEFADFLLQGTDGVYAAIEFPKEVIELVKRHLYTDEASDSFHAGLDVDELFGLTSHRDFYPPSAIRGPFWPLLRFGFKENLPFVIEFVNRACERYVHPLGNDSLEEAWEVEITLPAGKKVKQWHNPRFWQMFRGTSVGPYVMMCTLMSLEQVLFEFGRAKVEYLDAWLIFILNASNNSALAAVVASVATRFPKLCPQTIKTLLTCRDYVEFDQQMAGVGDGISRMQEIIPDINAKNKIYNNERKESDALPHRKKYIGTVALELQMGTWRDEIQAVIDAHQKLLPAPEKQTKLDKLWRFHLHKIDLRTYSPRPAKRKELEPKKEGELTEEQANETVGVVLEPNAPANDIKEILDEDRPRLDLQNKRIGLFNWAYALFSGQGSADPTQWQSYLTEAMASPPVKESEDEMLAITRGPSVVAAVCARDHWKELTAAQKEWCMASMEEAIARDRDSTNDTLRIQRFAMSPDRSSAFVISKVIEFEKSGPLRERALKALGGALFHACDEVTQYAAAGIGLHLTAGESSVALNATYAICEHAQELDKFYDAEMKKPWDKRKGFSDSRLDLDKKMRERWVSGSTFDPKSLSGLDPTRPCSSEALKLLLYVFRKAPPSASANAFFEKVAAQVCDWWEAKGDRQERVPFSLLYECLDALAEYTMKLNPKDAIALCQPLLGMIESYPREVSEFIKKLTHAVDSNHSSVPTFWALWDEFATRLSSVSWIQRLSSERFSEDEILGTLFLAYGWKQGVKTWTPQEGYLDRVASLFQKLPAAGPVFDHFCAYLFYIGDMTLPSAFVVLANKIKEAPTAIAGKNVVYYLEQILQRFVYGAALKLKKDPAVRTAVIYCLDQLVELGSSAAYKMRDDFVTPLKE